MHRPTGIRGPFSLVLMGSTLLAGCDAAGATAEGHPHPAEEHMPRWASFDLRADPAVAASDLRLAVASAEDGVAFRTIDVPVGTVIRWSEVVGEGTFRLRSRAPDCQSDVVLPAERSTAILFRHEAASCSFEVVDATDSGETASLAVRVTAQPWSELIVEAISLDAPRQPVPTGVPPDEGGLAQLSPLYPGRYEIRLRRGDRVLERLELDVAPTGPQDSTISLTFDGVSD